MVRPLRIQYPGAYYHVTCRGNERRRVFYDDKDHALFFEKLSLSLEIYNVVLLAYVCMPNHFHLLLTTPDGNLSAFMRHFNISYTAAFNRRHRRVGHLYQGRYKAYLVEADNYLLEVSRYIHLNPIRIKALSKKSFEEKWEVLLKHTWSSLAGYVSGKKRKEFISYTAILEYMGGDNRRGREEYKRFVQEGIAEDLHSPLEIGKGHGVVGKTEFIEWIKDKFLSTETSSREQPSLKELMKLYTPQELIEQYAQLVGKKRADLCYRGKHSIERAMLMELLYRFCQITQPEIGKLVGGIDYSSVSQSRGRLRRLIEREPKIRKMFEKLSNRLTEMSRSKI